MRKARSEAAFGKRQFSKRQQMWVPAKREMDGVLTVALGLPGLRVLGLRESSRARLDSQALPMVAQAATAKGSAVRRATADSDTSCAA